MAAEALHYATPRRDALAPRADWLAVFSFLWTFAVSLPAGAWIAFRVEQPAPLHFALGVLMPLVAVVCAHISVERGAAWDSGYRGTAFAVWAAPFAVVLVSAGLLFWIGCVPSAPR